MHVIVRNNLANAPWPRKTTHTNRKAIRRIVIFDNHPDSLRLVLESDVDSDNDDAAARWERRASMICGSILIAIVLAAMLWPLYW
jgi:hypothetical protein